MSFQDLVNTTQTYFPEIQVKYKNESFLMKIIGKILFFNPHFMTKDITVIGHTIYYPSSHFIKLHPITSAIEFLYRLVNLQHTKQQAYISSLYCLCLLGNRLNFNSQLEKRANGFDKALILIHAGKRPFEDPIFDMLDILVTKV